ncbi:hypothetical protein E2C01_081684 [Portunus trituberculatus]|uniref:Uncharacterized protein n=1 Tax=Portunus trituberculatus TaxID=210409 RepID=A0A5B7J1T2_PORTR|nr:hypothetical protein [Portunus trituberculatus]
MLCIIRGRYTVGTASVWARECRQKSDRTFPWRLIKKVLEAEGVAIWPTPRPVCREVDKYGGRLIFYLFPDCVEPRLKTVYYAAVDSAIR